MPGFKIADVPEWQCINPSHGDHCDWDKDRIHVALNSQGHKREIAWSETYGDWFERTKRGAGRTHGRDLPNGHAANLELLRRENEHLLRLRAGKERYEAQVGYGSTPRPTRQTESGTAWRERSRARSARGRPDKSRHWDHRQSGSGAAASSSNAANDSRLEQADETLTWGSIGREIGLPDREGTTGTFVAPTSKAAARHCEVEKRRKEFHPTVSEHTKGSHEAAAEQTARAQQEGNTLSARRLAQTAQGGLPSGGGPTETSDLASAEPSAPENAASSSAEGEFEGELPQSPTEEGDEGTDVGITIPACHIDPVARTAHAVSVSPSRSIVATSDAGDGQVNGSEKQSEAEDEPSPTASEVNREQITLFGKTPKGLLHPSPGDSDIDFGSPAESIKSRGKATASAARGFFLSSVTGGTSTAPERAQPAAASGSRSIVVPESLALERDRITQAVVDDRRAREPADCTNASDIICLVDVHGTLDDGSSSSRIPDERAPAVRQLEEVGARVKAISYIGVTGAHTESVHKAIKGFNKKHGLHVEVVITDQHAGLPFGRPDLRQFKPRADASHEYSTGGKDYFAWQYGAAFLIDDNDRNIGPAREIGVQCYRIGRRRGEYSFATATQAVLQAIEKDHEWYTVGALRNRLQRPKEAPRSEREAHRGDNRRCFTCGRTGHVARDCTSART